MSTGAKTTMILLAIAGLAMIGGLAFLAVDASGTPDADLSRKDVDLYKVAEMYVKNVKTQDDLPKFEALLNDPQKSPYDGEGKVIVTQVEDGTVLGWTDKNSNNKYDGVTDLETAAKASPKNLPDEPELIFRMRLDTKKNELVLSDRYGGFAVYDVGEDFKSSDMYSETTRRQRHYHGGFIFIPYGGWGYGGYSRGYYGNYSSARASSVGGRFGSGGVGGGK